MRAQRPSEQPQRLASAVSQPSIMVHMVSAVFGLLLALATQALAWQGSEGPQSASLLHASSLFFAAGRWQARSVGLGSPGLPRGGGATGSLCTAEGGGGSLAAGPGSGRG